MTNQGTCLVAYFSTDNVTYISTEKIKINQAKVNTSLQHQHKYTKKHKQKIIPRNTLNTNDLIICYLIKYLKTRHNLQINPSYL